NRKSARAMLHDVSKTITEGPHRRAIGHHLDRRLEKRVKSAQDCQFLRREIAASFASVHATHKDRQVSGYVTPEAQRGAMPPALRPHHLPIERGTPQGTD